MEVTDMIEVLSDPETLMRNHDATLKRKARNEVAALMNYLLTNGRGDDALRATEDEEYLEELLAELNAVLAAR